MNKERFILCNKTTYSNVWDTWEKQCYGWEYVVSLLNEQQDTIGEQKIAIDELITDYKKLEKENEQLRQFINKGRRLSVKELMNNNK